MEPAAEQSYGTGSEPKVRFHMYLILKCDSGSKIGGRGVPDFSRKGNSATANSF